MNPRLTKAMPTTALALFVIAVCLSGCGQKGPLFKPEAPDREQQEATS